MDANLSSILQVALQQGIWAALYIYLFFRMLKENAEREAKYQSMIDTLSGSILKGIDDIQDRLDLFIQSLGIISEKALNARHVFISDRIIRHKKSRTEVSPSGFMHVMLTQPCRAAARWHGRA